MFSTALNHCARSTSGGCLTRRASLHSRTYRRCGMKTLCRTTKYFCGTRMCCGECGHLALFAPSNLASSKCKGDGKVSLCFRSHSLLGGFRCCLSCSFGLSGHGYLTCDRLAAPRCTAHRGTSLMLGCAVPALHAVVNLARKVTDKHPCRGPGHPNLVGSRTGPCGDLSLNIAFLTAGGVVVRTSTAGVLYHGGRFKQVSNVPLQTSDSRFFCLNIFVALNGGTTCSISGFWVRIVVGAGLVFLFLIFTDMVNDTRALALGMRNVRGIGKCLCVNVCGSPRSFVGGPMFKFEIPIRSSIVIIPYRKLPANACTVSLFRSRGRGKMLSANSFKHPARGFNFDGGTRNMVKTPTCGGYIFRFERSVVVGVRLG